MGKTRKSKKVIYYRSAITGRFVSKRHAQKRRRTTVAHRRG
jgi:hypothetical protein